MLKRLLCRLLGHQIPLWFFYVEGEYIQMTDRPRENFKSYCPRCWKELPPVSGGEYVDSLPGTTYYLPTYDTN